VDILHIIILAVLQGLTEFLPISSSAHLILLPKLVNWPDQGLAFDVALHLGTLIAVVLYFRKDLGRLIYQWLKSFKNQRLNHESRLAWGVIVGTMPVGLAGLLISHSNAENYLRLPSIIATSTIIFAIFLWLADSLGKRKNDEYSLTWFSIIMIGCAQALALIPGTSRSGVTITAALFLGLNRKASARFSFLLSIPVIILAGTDKAFSLIIQDNSVEWFALFLGALLSGISAYLCIHIFIKLLDRMGMLPFVIYRILLGIILFAIVID